MTVSTTTDAPVDLEVDLLQQPFVTAPPAPFVNALSEAFGAAVDRGGQGFEAKADQMHVADPERSTPPRIAALGLASVADLNAETPRTAVAAGRKGPLDYGAEKGGCLFPLKKGSGDARTVQLLVKGVVLGSYRYRQYKTADGFNGPSAFRLRAGEDYEETAVPQAPHSLRRLYRPRSREPVAPRAHGPSICGRGGDLRTAHGDQVDSWGRIGFGKREGDLWAHRRPLCSPGFRSPPSTLATPLSQRC